MFSKDVFDTNLASLQPCFFSSITKSVILAPLEPTFGSVINLLRSNFMSAVSNTIAHELTPQVGKLP